MSQKEIVDIAVTLYDELRIGEQGFCPVAKSGFIKCKICGEDKCKSEVLIYENSEYGDNIKEYIDAPFIHAVGGSWVCPKADIAAGNFEKITKLCAEARQAAFG